MSQSARMCVYDTRRGQQEGEEADKILAFYPPFTPLPEQLAVVGLSEGMILFTRIFSQDAPCESMDAEKHRHVLLEVEPFIWMVLVVEKGGSSGLEEGLRDEAPRGLLREAHALFVLFYGPLADLLEEDETAELARACLGAFLPDYLQVGVSKRWRIPTLAESLSERGTMQLMPIDRVAALRIQALIASLETQSGGGAVHGTMILYHNLLVASTLPPEDCATLYSYACLQLVPSVPKGNQPKSAQVNPSQLSLLSLAAALPSQILGPSRPADPGTMPGLGQSSGRTSQTQQTGGRGSALRGLFHGGIHSARERVSSAADVAAGHNPGTAETPPGGVAPKPLGPPRPMATACWHKETGGFLGSTAWGFDEEGRPVAPAVRLGTSQAAAEFPLLVFQQRYLTLVALQLPGTYRGRAALQKMAPALDAAEQALAQQWGGPLASHIPGHRYLCLHPAARTAQATPAAKVGTLSKDSLGALNQVRAEADAQKRRHVAELGPGAPLEGEVCMRAANHVWVIVRQGCGQELYTVMERASETLLRAADSVESLSNQHFGGAFSSD